MNISTNMNDFRNSEMTDISKQTLEERFENNPVFPMREKILRKIIKKNRHAIPMDEYFQKIADTSTSNPKFAQANAKRRENFRKEFYEIEENGELKKGYALFWKEKGIVNFLYMQDYADIIDSFTRRGDDRQHEIYLRYCSYTRQGKLGNDVVGELPFNLFRYQSQNDDTMDLQDISELNITEIIYSSEVNPYKGPAMKFNKYWLNLYEDGKKEMEKDINDAKAKGYDWHGEHIIDFCPSNYGFNGYIMNMDDDEKESAAFIDMPTEPEVIHVCGPVFVAFEYDSSKISFYSQCQKIKEYFQTCPTITA